MSIIQFGSLDDVVTAHEIEEHGLEEGKQAGMLVPFFRSANTEINTTLAIALVAMFMVHFWGFKTLGLMEHAGKFINFKWKLIEATLLLKACPQTLFKFKSLNA